MQVQRLESSGLKINNKKRYEHLKIGVVRWVVLRLLLVSALVNRVIW